MAKRRRRGSANAERYTPLVLLIATFMAAAALLPTSLRPPAQQPSATAELSPDAPPDEDAPSLISSLNRATSGVDTTADGEATGAGEGATTTTVPPAPPTTLVPRACPKGFGDPPRQTESVYAPLCAAPFSGDNGGATWKGVTATEIGISVQGWVGHTNNIRGRLGTEPRTGESATDRTFRVLQNYLNSAFQFYGRQLVFYVADPDTYNSTNQSDANQRRAAQTAANTYNVFGSSMTSVSGCDEFARLQRVAMCYTSPTQKWYRDHAPYNYSWFMNSSELMQFTAEFACKQLVGRPAAHAGPSRRDKTRKFGIVYYDGQSGDSVGVNSYWTPAAGELERHLRACGAVPVMVAYSNEGGTGRQAIATAISRLNAEEVTTVIPMLDWDTNAAFTNAAEVNRYEPEYFVTGAGALDTSNIGRFANQNQWSRAFGLTAREPGRNPYDTDCWKAYQSMDPANTPARDMCYYVWHTMWALAVGIQMAGPKLTPTTFHRGLQDYGSRYFDTPRWAVGGSFGPDRYTYTGDVAIMWYDRTAPDPVDNGAAGAYRYVRDGTRFRLGSIPTGDVGLFVEGISEVKK